MDAYFNYFHYWRLKNPIKKKKNLGKCLTKLNEEIQNPFRVATSVLELLQVLNIYIK